MSFSKENKPDAPTTPLGRYESFLKTHLCTFQTAGRRCQMLGGHIDTGRENGLCSWHWLSQSTPEFLQDREEFIRYRERDRNTYPKDWAHAGLYVDDELAWACTLGKEQHIEFARAERAIENECDEEVFGDKGRGSKEATPDQPPTPEVSVQQYAKNLPF